MMEVVKKNQKDMMKDVVKGYRGCGHKEYFGMIHWRDGLQYCRQCIYELWQKESGWKPGKDDYVFPYYEDGVNYYKEDQNEEGGEINKMRYFYEYKYKKGNRKRRFCFV